MHCYKCQNKVNEENKHLEYKSNKFENNKNVI